MSGHNSHNTYIIKIPNCAPSDVNSVETGHYSSDICLSRNDGEVRIFSDELFIERQQICSFQTLLRDE